MSAELAAAVLTACVDAGLQVVTAESCTGGMVAAALTDIPGSSRVVERGFVTYSNEAKIELLGVPEHLFAEHGAVSEPVAEAMALGALRASRAQLSVSITGVAGPGGTALKPEGMVCFAVAKDGVPIALETKQFGALGRAGVRDAARDHALELLLQAAVTP